MTKDNIIYVSIMIGIVVAGMLLRIWNIVLYNTWWADDGGAHLEYIEHIIQTGSLPTFADTYLAWHEPVYYVLMAGWQEMLTAVHRNSLNALELTQIWWFVMFSVCTVLLARLYTSSRIAHIGTLLFVQFVFVFVKLSAYVTNELMTQAWILASVYLYMRWRLWDRPSWKQVTLWAIVVSVGMLVKLTVVLVPLVATVHILFVAIRDSKKELLQVLGILYICIVCFQLPWIMHKQSTFGAAFSINLYEQETKQSLFSSTGYKTLVQVPLRTFFAQPYWETKPHSFWIVLFADTYGDYYNLFQHVDASAATASIETSNGRYTTPERIRAHVYTYAAAGVVSFIVLIGLIGTLFRPGLWMDDTRLMFFLLIGSGVGATIYNMLRHPYYERGTVKMQFIAYVLPLAALIAYDWLGSRSSRPLVHGALVIVPLCVYVFFAYSIIVVG